ncbi:MAG TPA: glycine cleavage system aminomethyltransferase GcvT [Hyphomicrobiales bacterium]|nr:glycine cleavage system aminomethyltransferase GcvT [Hyphomicrobiales bacterium]
MAEATRPSLDTALARTPLYELHLELGAKMVPFAGYEMPVQYPMGVLGEHIHTRDRAGLFDVSHMGQAFLVGPDHETVAAELEALTPGEIKRLGRGRQRYTQLLNDKGGIIDDLMVTRLASEEDDGRLMLVVNAARKADDFAHIEERLPSGVKLEVADERALIALQGPAAAEIMAECCPEAAELAFMAAASTRFDGVDCHVSRSGYTGEDGFEISLAAAEAMEVARTLLAHPDVAPIGLGARDSLRLEAGLCLYGNDIDETTSPVEANLSWSIGKRRREEGGFPGQDRILKELADGPSRLRVGILPLVRAPAREGTEIVTKDGKPIGEITSGGFGPTFGGPVAMGYVAAEHAVVGAEIGVMVREVLRPARIAEMPFVPHRYLRKPKGN